MLNKINLYHTRPLPHAKPPMSHALYCNSLLRCCISDTRLFVLLLCGVCRITRCVHISFFPPLTRTHTQTVGIHTVCSIATYNDYNMRSISAYLCIPLCRVCVPIAIATRKNTHKIHPTTPLSSTAPLHKAAAAAAAAAFNHKFSINKTQIK